MRCAELCGLWHGAMFDYGRVVSVARVPDLGRARREVQLADVTAILPPYATTYDPTVVPQINKAMAKAGIAGGERLLLPAATTRCSHDRSRPRSARPAAASMKR